LRMIAVMMAIISEASSIRGWAAGRRERSRARARRSQ
jgi:hypothetical protein